ncbi:ATPase, V1 complex, subunit C [Globomyces pollinis-pini]|nr:ATPase, V1 complex, subunit C [Globomyces pollinis-pini]
MTTLPNIWFISAPANPTKSDTISKLKDKIDSKNNDYATLFPFIIPDFKVGTLDSLVLLSDELAKADIAMENIVLKISDSLKSLLNNNLDQWKSLLSVSDKNIISYLESFSWNTMKYRSDKTLKELADNIIHEITTIDTVMKNKLQAYSATKSQLVAIDRKLSGNLSVKSLNEIVKKDHFVLDSEYLTSLIVAVPKASMKEWVDQYETLTQMVVPRSSQKIAEDDEYALFNVTLFQKVVDEFTTKCREHKFIVRDFKWNAEALSDEKKKYQELVQAEKDQLSSLIRLCKANFSETYASWNHLKILRLFIESILRYGLPPDFQPILVKAKPKQEKKVRTIINKHYAYIDKGNNISEETIDETLQMLIGDKDYSPVVLFALNTII